MFAISAFHPNINSLKLLIIYSWFKGDCSVLLLLKITLQFPLQFIAQRWLHTRNTIICNINVDTRMWENMQHKQKDICLGRDHSFCWHNVHTSSPLYWTKTEGQPSVNSIASVNSHCNIGQHRQERKHKKTKLIHFLMVMLNMISSWCSSLVKYLNERDFDFGGNTFLESAEIRNNTLL